MQHSTVTYSITGGADAGSFEIVGGVLKFVTAPDFESDATTYTVEVTADDGDNQTTANYNCHSY